MGQPTVLAADADTESNSPIDIMGTVADHDYFTFFGQNYIFLDYFYGKTITGQLSFRPMAQLKKP